MKNFDVAILLASFNGEVFIEKQISTILAQCGVNVHIFVSDDVSSDLTPIILNNLASIDNRISVISLKTKFGSAASNFYHLIKSCDVNRYDYVAFADQDDIWLEDKLISAINEMRERFAVGFSSSFTAYWPSSNQKIYVDKSSPRTGFDHWFESPGPGCTHVMERDAFQAIQNFCRIWQEDIEKIEYHDWLVYAFFVYNNLPWHISSVSKILYVQHNNNQFGVNLGLKAFIKRICLMRSGWYRKQIELIYFVLCREHVKLLTKKFILRHLFALRRKKYQSVGVGLSFLLRIW